jgi:aminoglycoside phosphotransferase (APT) family kinase protein
VSSCTEPAVPPLCLDVDRIRDWLGQPVVVEATASTGSSNVTWLVTVGGAPAVLRHPPVGPTLPTAHDLSRERRHLDALAGTPVPVPAVIAFCDDVEVIGTPFLITSRMECLCLLGPHPQVADRGRLAQRAIETLAAIHAFDWRGAGMGAPPGRYLSRQIARWTNQLDRTPTAGRLGDLAAISEWLLAHLPAAEETTVVHGDFGFHNLLVDPDRSVVTAVLDWELATLGDPLADLVSLVKGWGEDAAPANPANQSFSEGGWDPTARQLVAWYESCTGRSFGTNRHFYEIFGRWRSIGIMEGIFARSNGTRFGDDVPRLVDRTIAMIES